MKDKMEAMVTWHKEGYLDPEVWDNLCDKVNPSLMPAPSVLNIEKRKHCQLHYQVRFLKFDTFNKVFLFKPILSLSSPPELEFMVTDGMAIGGSGHHWNDDYRLLFQQWLFSHHLFSYTNKQKNWVCHHRNSDQQWPLA